MIFFLIGFTPWIVYNATNNFSSLKYWTGRSMFSTVFDRGESLVHKTYKLFSWGIPHSFHFEDAMLNFNERIPGFFSYSYYLIFLCGFLCLLYFNKDWLVYYFKGFYKKSLNVNSKLPEVFILSFPFLFTLVYIFSSFGIDNHGLRDSRHLIPLYLFIFIILSLFICKLLDNYKIIIKYIAYFFLIFLTVICIFPLVEVAPLQNLGSIRSVKYMTSCDWFSWTIQAYSNEPDFLEIANRCEKLESYPAPYIQNCYFNLGLGVSRYSPNWKTDSYKCDLIKNRDYSVKCHEGFAQGVGEERVIPYTQTLDEKCALVNESYKSSCYKGFGWTLGMAMGWDPFFDLAKCNEVNHAFIKECVSGAGAGIKLSMLHNPKRIALEAEKLDKEYRIYFYESFKKNKYGLG